ncbi:MAG: thioredoxin family protein [Promethearchaeota archaeon]
MPSQNEINQDAPSSNEAIEALPPAYRGGFIRQKNEYQLNMKAVEKLKNYFDEGYSIAAIFADWCGDARRAIPVLALLEKETGKVIPCLGGMTKPPYGSSGKFWAVPPSPPEVDIFEVKSSPTIIVFDKNGDEIGRIITRPKMTPSVEEELVKIIEDSNE